MKIDEYVPEAMPTSSANAKSLQRLAAEEQQREHRQQRAEARRQRAHDDLGHRAVDDLRERRARHPRDVLADAVEHDDRVVERVAQDGQQRRDRRRRHLPADEGVDARHDQDVVHQRDQHRHGELPLEAQRDVDRDDQQRGDDRDQIAELATRLAEARADRLRRSGCSREPEAVASSVLSTSSTPPAPSCLVEIWTTCLPSSALLSVWIFASAEARAARARCGPASTVAGLLQRRGDPRAAVEVDAEVDALAGDRQRADQQDARRTWRRTTSTCPCSRSGT